MTKKTVDARMSYKNVCGSQVQVIHRRNFPRKFHRSKAGLGRCYYQFIGKLLKIRSKFVNLSVSTIRYRQKLIFWQYSNF